MTLVRRVGVAATVLLVAGMAGLVVSEFAVGGGDPKKDEPKKKDPPLENISYYKQVRPIFQQHCQGCHQPAKASGGFMMISHADLFKVGESKKPGVVAGQPDKSHLV